MFQIPEEKWIPLFTGESNDMDGNESDPGEEEEEEDQFPPIYFKWKIKKREN